MTSPAPRGMGRRCRLRALGMSRTRARSAHTVKRATPMYERSKVAPPNVIAWSVFNTHQPSLPAGSAVSSSGQCLPPAGRQIEHWLKTEIRLQVATTHRDILDKLVKGIAADRRRSPRSEEHTSELQSLAYLVFRLL